MTTGHLAEPAAGRATNCPQSSTLSQLLPGAAGLLYAGVQLDGGIIAAAYRGISAVPDNRLNFPFSGSLATATSLTWGVTQALFIVTLVAFTRRGAVGVSRPGRIGARMAVVGGIAFVAAHAVSLTFRDARVDDPAGRAAITLFVIATLLTAAGFILSGVAVVRARRWTAWRRYSVLGVGLGTLCLLPLQFTPLLPLAIVLYAVTIAGFAAALLAQPEDFQR